MQNNQQTDQLYRYIFNDLNCRGEFVRLQQSLDSMFANHHYPQPVKKLLSEMMAITTLLTATLKFEGDIAVQIQGDGPVSYAVVNGNSQLQMRGMAKVQGELSSDDLQHLVGKAHLVITINPEQGERYQGIVAVEGQTIAQCIENYFQQSEQLQTKIWTATDLSSHNHRVGALFLQVLPVNDKQAKQDFEHLATLSQTVTAEELLTLDVNQLLLRLYHQDDPRIFEPKNVVYQCSCSRDKTATALRSMDCDSLLAQIDSQGPIKVDCQFCLKSYLFDKDDITAMHRNH